MRVSFRYFAAANGIVAIRVDDVDNDDGDDDGTHSKRANHLHTHILRFFYVQVFCLFACIARQFQNWVYQRQQQ